MADRVFIEGSLLEKFIAYTHVSDPRMLWEEEQKIREAEKISKFIEQNPHQTTYSESEAFLAKKLYRGCVHPQTGDIIHPFFRRAAFLPVNIPIYAGMLLSPSTFPWIVFWQFVNQSYNMGMNLANRNASNPIPNEEIYRNFGLAVGVSSTVGVGMKMMVQRFSNHPNVYVRAFMHGIVPLAATVAAGSLNLVLTRKDELKNGVDVKVNMYANSESMGKSQVAGFEAIKTTLFSRALMPIPSLLFPPLAMGALEKMIPSVGKSRLVKSTVYMGVVSGTLAFALPFSLTPFPW
eukprot:CAMPEP_0113872994 /NCGR_PEP_ID=MMETSP0780_2-20120614/3525_1 /TAXON_ID=652834 /ORGANISM="Palpitomonas bilix" /LENGTH=291 /DNA_ID=CAMNT_0000858593 /DNA_START=34 /DNA_END=906 /DNA_ORIENTATION=+ /assembly_acc=CAM_ASM_000599